MTDINKLLSPLFLEEKEIRKLIELLFFSNRDLEVSSADILEKINFSRTHYRIIYFIRKQKKITIQELIIILKISKQNLSRVLNQLIQNNYIKMEVGFDKRTKNITLTKKGLDFEKKISNIQIEKIRNILKNADGNDINSFKKILFSMINTNGKKIFNKLND